MYLPTLYSLSEVYLNITCLYQLINYDGPAITETKTIMSIAACTCITLLLINNNNKSGDLKLSKGYLGYV